MKGNVLPLLDGVTGDARVSPDGLYRYTLTRTWNPTLGAALFVMLNPSTADADTDDQTLRRCQHFARQAGCGSVTVANLFAWRARDPHELEVRGRDTVGPDNGAVLARLTLHASFVIAGWGAHRIAIGRGQWYRRLAAEFGQPLHALGFTQRGYPRHPLYLPNETTPVEWQAPRE